MTKYCVPKNGKHKGNIKGYKKILKDRKWWPRTRKILTAPMIGSLFCKNGFIWTSLDSFLEILLTGSVGGIRMMQKTLELVRYLFGVLLHICLKGLRHRILLFWTYYRNELSAIHFKYKWLLCAIHCVLDVLFKRPAFLVYHWFHLLEVVYVLLYLKRSVKSSQLQVVVKLFYQVV